MCLQESSADLAALEQLLAESKAEAELTALLAGDDGLAALNTLLAEQAASLDAWRAALERQEARRDCVQAEGKKGYGNDSCKKQPFHRAKKGYIGPELRKSAAFYARREALARAKAPVNRVQSAGKTSVIGAFW